MSNDPKTVSASVIDGKPAIWHPVVDFLLVGGASIIGGVGLIVWFTNSPAWVSEFDWDAGNEYTKNISQFWLFWIIALVISYPHLLASYRILYRSKIQIAKFRWFGIAVIVQIAHALQYLSFANRIERNLQLAENPRASVLKPVLLMLVLILCGFLVFVGPSAVVVSNNWSLHLMFAIELLVIAVNIHHCFIDGEIWKTSNREMRRTLLAHLEER